MSHVEGKVAVVTGGAGGFGLLIRRMLAERGATAVGFDVADAEGCRTVDVTDRAAVRAGIDGVVEEPGRVDILVKNAGVMHLAFPPDNAQAHEPSGRGNETKLTGYPPDLYSLT